MGQIEGAVHVGRVHPGCLKWFIQPGHVDGPWIAAWNTAALPDFTRRRGCSVHSCQTTSSVRNGKYTQCRRSDMLNLPFFMYSVEHTTQMQCSRAAYGDTQHETSPHSSIDYLQHGWRQAPLLHLLLLLKVLTHHSREQLQHDHGHQQCKGDEVDARHQLIPTVALQMWPQQG